jgi:hypothetical protein
MTLKKKVLTIELKTNMTNKDLKRLYENPPNEMPLLSENLMITIDQVQVNLVRDPKNK